MRLKPVLCLILLCALFSCAPSPRLASAEEKGAPPDKDAPHHAVRYEIFPRLNENPASVDVNMKFANDDRAEIITIQFPAWSPGDYNVEHHGQYVRRFEAYEEGGSDRGKELNVTHPDADTWTITTKGSSSLRVNYQLQETPPGNFSENIHLTPTQIFFNGPAAFPYIVGHKDSPVRLVTYAPNTWITMVPLKPEAAANTFSAPDYDTFADSPLLITAPDAAVVRTFNSGGTTFRTLFYGGAKNIRDPDAYTPVIRKLIQAETAVMGPMPTTHYDFFFDVNGRGGGLEHLNACRIALPGFGSPSRVAPFVAHEFFHLWNVKRIRPEALGPFDYIHPPKTRNLWFAEGVTEYYAHLATRRADLYSDDELLNHFRSAIRRFTFNAARKRVTADEASLRVWETETSEGYGGLSYYAKGELIGLCFDLKIRQITDNRKSLDDLMRLLMQRHAPPKPGYKEDELRDLLSEVAGQDLSKFYDQLARSTDDLPFAECLGYAGLDANGRPLPTVTDAQYAFLTHWLTGK